jgi:hypothetical protein
MRSKNFTSIYSLKFENGIFALLQASLDLNGQASTSILTGGEIFQEYVNSSIGRC